MVRILHCAEPAEILAEAKKFGVELEDFSKLAEEVLARDRRSGFFL